MPVTLVVLVVVLALVLVVIEQSVVVSEFVFELVFRSRAGGHHTDDVTKTSGLLGPT